MNTYYVAGIPYSDELFHHGIKGQKWGIRRYQNPDGTLTSEGQKRYGSLRGQYARSEQGVLRALGTGNWALGKKAGGERREARLEKKLTKANEKGKTNTEKLAIKYEAQKARNIARDRYNARTSTGILLAQKVLLGRSGADAYKVARERGAGMVESLVPTILQRVTGLPLSTAISAKFVEGQIARERYKDD